MNEADNRQSLQRINTGIIVAVAVVVTLLLVWLTMRVMLVLFAGILFAIFLGAIVDWIRRLTGLRRGWSLAIVLIALGGVATGLILLLAPSVSEQVRELAHSLPGSLDELRATLKRLGVADWIVAQIPGSMQSLAKGSGIFERITGVFSSTLGAIADTALILFIGIYGAAQPELYANGLVRLFPIRHRPRARQVLTSTTEALRSWLIARAASMILVGVVTALGLWLLGVPLALTFGLLAALLDFIPNIGPIIAAIPAILLALTHDPSQALYVTILYLGIQSLEGYIITPIIQQRAVSLPPVLTLLIQVLLGVLAGGLGIALATPLLAVIMVVTRMVYIQDVLGDHADEDAEKPTPAKDTPPSDAKDAPDPA